MIQIGAGGLSAPWLCPLARVCGVSTVLFHTETGLRQHEEPNFSEAKAQKDLTEKEQGHWSLEHLWKGTV